MDYKTQRVRNKEELINISDEDAHMWGVFENPLSDFDEAHLAAYYKAIDGGALKKLTIKERLFWKLAFFKCMALSDIAKREHVSLEVVYSTLKRAGKRLKKMAYKYVYKKPIHPDFTGQGFQKNIRVRTKKDELKNSCTIEKEFKNRERLHKEEIDSFYRLHPELKDGGKSKI